MQDNAIYVITRGVDIYELILQSQRLQIPKMEGKHILATQVCSAKTKIEKSTNGKQPHIGNTMIVTSNVFIATAKMLWINELYSAPKSALSQGSLQKGTTP